MFNALHNIPAPAIAMLICWFVFLSASIWSYFKFQRYTLPLLFVSAVSIAAAFALFSPYLNVWDEQFHALVGKNLAANPSLPQLYRMQPLPLDQTWLNTKIWLHKQPLFTWQIALSVKLFGSSAFAVRLPSVLFHGVFVFTVFRIGLIIFNRRTAFIAALIVMNSSYVLGLISGKIGTDHNDFIFLCYNTLAFWAWIELQHDQKQKWLYWIGVFAGCAILTKWLVGLIVFGSWGFVILININKLNFITAIRQMLTSLAVCILIVLPWQIYTFVRFPVQAKAEMKYNSDHIFRSVEGHTGKVGFHFEQINSLYFELAIFLPFFLLGVYFLIKKTPKPFAVFLLATISIIYLFFSIVQTKMPGFTVPVYGLVILIIAFGLNSIIEFLQKGMIRKIGAVVLIALVLNLVMKPARTISSYGFDADQQENDGRKKMLKALRFIEVNKNHTETRIVFGVDFFPLANISWMFYTNDIAYGFIPPLADMEKLIKQGYPVYIVGDNKLYKLNL